MPTIFILLGFKFSFFANDHLPIHVHVTKGGSMAKFVVFPEIFLAENYGFKPKELKIITEIITENQQVIIERWNEFFNQN